jgi:hypothetical protein
MNKTLVISRYDEDTDWLLDVSSWNIIVYDKGTTNDNNFPTNRLPNVGREAETYLNYIVHNYNNLSDYTGFLQGRPFDHFHFNDWTKNIHNCVAYINDFTISRDFMFFGEQPLYICDHTGLPHHPGLDLGGYSNRMSINIPPTLNFRAGAQFIVSRDKVLNKPLSFYSNILESVNKERDPKEAYLLERLWQYVFE